MKIKLQPNLIWQSALLFTTFLLFSCLAISQTENQKKLENTSKPPFFIKDKSEKEGIKLISDNSTEYTITVKAEKIELIIKAASLLKSLFASSRDKEFEKWQKEISNGINEIRYLLTQVTSELQGLRVEIKEGWRENAKNVFEGSIQAALGSLNEWIAKRNSATVRNRIAHFLENTWTPTRGTVMSYGPANYNLIMYVYTFEETLMTLSRKPIADVKVIKGQYMSYLKLTARHLDSLINLNQGKQSDLVKKYGLRLKEHRVDLGAHQYSWRWISCDWKATSNIVGGLIDGFSSGTPFITGGCVGSEPPYSTLTQVVFIESNGTRHTYNDNAPEAIREFGKRQQELLARIENERRLYFSLLEEEQTLISARNSVNEFVNLISAD